MSKNQLSTFTRILALSIAPLCLAACGDDAVGGDGGNNYGSTDLTNPGTVAELASSSSAPAVFATAVTLVALVDLDEACPVKTMQGATTTYEGGCTDASGNSWTGRATTTGSGASSTITYQGLALTSVVDNCGGETNTVEFEGTVKLTPGPNGDGADFDIDLEISGGGVDEDTCLAASGSSSIDYTGSTREAPTYGAEADLWTGQGTIGSSELGTIQARTEGEILEGDACDTEALMGKTTLESGGNVVEILYDGETDCDPNSTVTWTLDGAPQGEIEGISCSVAPLGRGSTGGWLLLAAAGLFGLGRVRRRSC